jgi:predicted GNAT family N-acyltransferase
MATEPARRAAGGGRAVLAAVVDHVTVAGGAHVWCNARVSARRFYERGSFAAHGEPWGDPDLGPHVAMWRAVGPPGAAAGGGRPEAR